MLGFETICWRVGSLLAYITEENGLSLPCQPSVAQSSSDRGGTYWAPSHPCWDLGWSDPAGLSCSPSHCEPAYAPLCPANIVCFRYLLLLTLNTLFPMTLEPWRGRMWWMFHLEPSSPLSLILWTPSLGLCINCYLLQKETSLMILEKMRTPPHALGHVRGRASCLPVLPPKRRGRSSCPLLWPSEVGLLVPLTPRAEWKIRK